MQLQYKDDIKQGWVKEDSILLFDKGRSASIMASEYMAPGRNLQLSADILSMSNHVSLKETALRSVLKSLNRHKRVSV